MKVGDRLETVIHRVEFYQSHVLFVGVAQNLDCLDPPVLAKDLVEGIFPTDVLLKGADMESLGRGVDCKRAIRGESE